MCAKLTTQPQASRPSALRRRGGVPIPRAIHASQEAASIAGKGEHHCHDAAVSDIVCKTGQADPCIAGCIAEKRGLTYQTLCAKLTWQPQTSRDALPEESGPRISHVSHPELMSLLCRMAACRRRGSVSVPHAAHAPREAESIAGEAAPRGPRAGPAGSSEARARYTIWRHLRHVPTHVRV